jgi:competence protein ComEC
LLIDAGGSASAEFDTGDFIVAPFLRSRKILKVDYLLVSHPRVDHYGGMKSIVEQFAPEEFWAGPSKGRTARYEGLEEAVDRAGVKKLYLSSRDPCRVIEQVKICVLYPAEDKTGDLSVVLRLSFGEVDLLFSGDIDAKDEAALLRTGADLSSAVIKVPRHGSATASAEEFVAAVKPKLAIFSVGQRNSFGLPRDEVLANYTAAGAEVLRTDRDGAITIETDGRAIRYRTYRRGTTGTLPQSFIR